MIPFQKPGVGTFTSFIGGSDGAIGTIPEGALRFTIMAFSTDVTISGGMTGTLPGMTADSVSPIINFGGTPGFRLAKPISLIAGSGDPYLYTYDI